MTVVSPGFTTGVVLVHPLNVYPAKVGTGSIVYTLSVGAVVAVGTAGAPAGTVPVY